MFCKLNISDLFQPKACKSGRGLQSS